MTTKIAKRQESLCAGSKKGSGDGLYVFEGRGPLNVGDERGDFDEVRILLSANKLPPPKSRSGSVCAHIQSTFKR